MSAPSCYQHAQVPATARCGGCLQPICPACTVFEGGKDLCPPCVARYWRARKRQKIGAGVGGAALLVVGLVVLARAVSASAPAVPSEPGFDYGPKSAIVAKLRAELVREPCDRTRAVQFAQLLFSLQDWRGTLQYSDDFITRCGRFPQLRSLTYSAHIRLSEFDLAIRDASELIESAPGNAGYWVWRALAHQSRGAPDKALDDFREAFRLQPAEFQVANQLASAYEVMGRPCEGVLVMQEHERASPEIAKRIVAEKRAAQLAAQGSCPADKGPAEAPVHKPGTRASAKP